MHLEETEISKKAAVHGLIPAVELAMESSWCPRCQECLYSQHWILEHINRCMESGYPVEQPELLDYALLRAMVVVETIKLNGHICLEADA